MHTIFIVTEANEKVATGHLMECIVLSSAIQQAGFDVELWVNDDAPSELKSKIPCKSYEYSKDINLASGLLVERIKKENPRYVIFNLREIRNELLRVVNSSKPDGMQTICVDEFGGRKLDADIIVNPMIDSYYWSYPDTLATLYCGAEYLVLFPELKELHNRKKKINPEIKKVVVTMGGVDPRHYTEELVKYLPELLPGAHIDIVIGGGISKEREAQIRLQAGELDKLFFYRNIPYLRDMMFEADLVFCAGGNTLHEAACIGTPAVVIPSMPHEVRNGIAFQERGFGICISKGVITKEILQKNTNRMMSADKRKLMSDNGKKISDGMGKDRMVDILCKRYIELKENKDEKFK